MNRKEYLINGIRAYGEEQKRLIKFIRDNGGRISDDQFDNEFDVFTREFVGYKNGLKMYKPIIKRNNYMFIGLDKNSFILGSGPMALGGMSILSQWIHLCQIMVEIGLIKRRIYKKKNKVYYYINNQKG